MDDREETLALLRELKAERAGIDQDIAELERELEGTNPW